MHMTFKKTISEEEEITIDEGEFHKKERMTFKSLREWQETMDGGDWNRL